MSSATDADLDSLRSEIERHREGLGETVEALTAKFDVTAFGKYLTNVILDDTILRAQEAIGHGRERLRSAGDQAMRLPGRIFSGKSAGAGPGFGAAVAGAAIGAGIATAGYVLTRRYISPMWRHRSRTGRSVSR
jgi:uncharacterized protein DUF3618